MQTYKLQKEKREVLILIGREKAEVKTRVDGMENTQVQVLTPLEANRLINDLLRDGYQRV